MAQEGYVQLVRDIFGLPPKKVVLRYIEKDGARLYLADVLESRIGILPFTRARARMPPKPMQAMALDCFYGLYRSTSDYRPEEIATMKQGTVKRHWEEAMRQLCADPKLLIELAHFLGPTPEWLAEMRAKIAGIEKLQEEIELLRREVDELQAVQHREAQLQEELKRFKREMDDLRREINDLQGEVDRWRKELEDMSAKETGVRAELTGLQATHEVLCATHQKLEDTPWMKLGKLLHLI